MVSKIRKTKSGIKQLLIPGMFFEEMGIVYLGIGGRWRSSWNCEAF